MDSEGVQGRVRGYYGCLQHIDMNIYHRLESEYLTNHIAILRDNSCQDGFVHSSEPHYTHNWVEWELE